MTSFLTRSTLRIAKASTLNQVPRTSVSPLLCSSSRFFTSSRFAQNEASTSTTISNQERPSESSSILKENSSESENGIYAQKQKNRESELEKTQRINSYVQEAKENYTVVEYPYYVQRSCPGGNLPVYPLYKAGKRYFTVIRKIEGNGYALSNKIKETFPRLQVKHVTLTNQVVIKGLHVHEIKHWLAAEGF